MKKIASTLFSLMLSAASFAGVNMENAYWIIKDGHLAEGIENLPYADLEGKIPCELVEKNVGGEDVMEYRQLSIGTDLLDVMLTFGTPLDLTKNYVLVMDYMVPESHGGTNLVEGNKPLFVFGFAKDTASLKAKNAPHSDVSIFIDAKWNKPGQWNSTERYIFSNPEFTTIEGMQFTYAREYIKGDLAEFPYIKNLAIAPYEEGVKPFYAEDFDGYGIGEFWQEKNAALGKGVTYYTGGIKPVVTENDVENFEDNAMPVLTFFRDFQPDSTMDSDGSGYLDDEILHAIQIENGRDSVVFPGIAIPAGYNKIYTSMLAKMHKTQKLSCKKCNFEDYEGQPLPIKLKFNTGEIVDLTNATIQLTWTKFFGEIDVPTGATSCDLIFSAFPWAYLADEVMLSAVKYSSSVENILADNNAFQIEAYVDQDGKIVVLNGKIVAMYNMSGKIASENDKIVAIVVENEAGARASKVMIRK